MQFSVSFKEQVLGVHYVCFPWLYLNVKPKSLWLCAFFGGFMQSLVLFYAVNTAFILWVLWVLFMGYILWMSWSLVSDDKKQVEYAFCLCFDTHCLTLIAELHWLRLHGAWHTGVLHRAWTQNMDYCIAHIVLGCRSWVVKESEKVL